MNKIFTSLLWVTVLINSLHAQNTVANIAKTSENPPGGKNTVVIVGNFITIKELGGFEFRAYVAGPEDSKTGILLIHDFFGITPATKEAVERLGALGYRTVAVDLYRGKSATNNDSAEVLMQTKDRKETDRILKDGIDYLKRPGRKLATIGFSAGGVDALNANLLDPESFSGTVIVYGGGYDKIEKSRIEKLRSPVFAITGALDEWPVQAALNFFANEKGKMFELYIYPGAYHAYAQPYFMNGKNYNAEATRVTWKLIEDFLSRHLSN